jgi:phosphotriesterase-related protein
VTGLVRTVLGDLAADLLGVTYCHEHLIIDSSIVASHFPVIHLPSVEDAVAEASLCAETGVEAMVDAMPVGCGGHLERLAEIARRTGLHLIAATGMHIGKYYEAELSLDPDDLGRRFVMDIDAGCGVIKVAWSQDEADARGRALFEAAATAHLRTGIPILTHCEEGHGGAAQVALLMELGVNPGRVTLSHTDKEIDSGYHLDLLATGVNLEFDQTLRVPDRTLAIATAVVEAGFGDRIMLGTDGARRSLWTTLGGSPGLAWLLSGFVPRLRDRIGATGVEAILIDNPRRWLARNAVARPAPS